MKCGEEKPACLRCTSTGRTCDGYPAPKIACRETQIIRLVKPALIRAPSVDINGIDSERSGFEYFRSRTIAELSRVLELRIWTQALLQSSHFNDAVRHAAVALGALNERFELHKVLTMDNEQANARQQFATRQYQKAVVCLRKQLQSNDPPPIECTLMACFLFMCFEFMHGNDKGVVMHLRNGLKIIERMSLNTKHCLYSDSSDPSSCDQTGRIFSTLDTQTNLWLSLSTHQAPNIWPIRFPATSIHDNIGPFTGLCNAREALDDLWNTIIGLRKVNDAQRESRLPVSPLDDRQGEAVDIQLGKWALAFKTWTDELQDKISVTQVYEITTLRISHRIACISLAVVAEPNEEAFFETVDPTFREIVCLANSLLQNPNGRRFLASQPPKDPGQDPLAIFSFPITAGIIHSLYFTAVRCSDEKIAQDAIMLMLTSPWREGAWDSAAMGRIAQGRRQTRSFNVKL